MTKPSDKCPNCGSSNVNLWQPLKNGPHNNDLDCMDCNRSYALDDMRWVPK